MKTAYLIRHALPEFPGGRRMCLGATDIPLGKEGFLQAGEMAQRLPPVTAVFSSPLTRAIQTAQAIGLPVTVFPGLQELHMGQWDGLTFDQIRQMYPQLYAARGNDPTLPIPGAEDRESGYNRFQNAMRQAGESASGDFAVVAHGGIISLFLEKCGLGNRKPDYTQIIPLFYENGAFFAVNSPE